MFPRLRLIACCLVSNSMTKRPGDLPSFCVRAHAVRAIVESIDYYTCLARRHRLATCSFSRQGLSDLRARRSQQNGHPMYRKPHLDAMFVTAHHRLVRSIWYPVDIIGNRQRNQLER